MTRGGGAGARGQGRSRKGLLKTISKMGISTIPSYCGAQIFEASGSRPSSSSGTSPARRRASAASALDELARGGARPARARVSGRRATSCCRSSALYAWRRDGEHHQWNPETIALLQHAVRARRLRRPTRSTRRRVNDDARAALDAARPAALPARRGRRHPARRGRAGERDRQALLDRRDVARLALARGARDARDRDEPASAAGRTPARAARIPCATSRRERRLAPLGDQAGRVGPLRRQHRLPDERRRAADQDGAGREARRGRPAARPQGRPLHRERPLHDAGRRA